MKQSLHVLHLLFNSFRLVSVNRTTQNGPQPNENSFVPNEPCWPNSSVPNEPCFEFSHLPLHLLQVLWQNWLFLTSFVLVLLEFLSEL